MVFDKDTETERTATHLALLVAAVSPRFGRRAVAPAWPLVLVWGLVWKCRWGSLHPEMWYWGKSWGTSKRPISLPDVVLRATQMFWGNATHRAVWRSSEALGCIRFVLASMHAPPGLVSDHFCCDPLRPAASVGLRPGNFWPCSEREGVNKQKCQTLPCWNSRTINVYYHTFVSLTLKCPSIGQLNLHIHTHI